MNTRASKSKRRTQGGNVSLLPAPAASQSDAPTSFPTQESSVQPNSILSHSAAFIEPEQRQAMIAEAAYYRAERRGFEPGHELEDWCGAESEIDGRLTRGEIPVACSL